MKTSLKKADMIIADSEYTKKEIIRIMGPEDGIKNRIKVIYIAADDYLKSYEIKKGPNSILYVGSNLANKNLKTLMRAFSLLVKKIPKSKLILVGKQLVGDEFLKRQIKELDLEKNIVFKGYIENIAKEYSRASLTVMPSLYEGFGLPVLEAMMCGCPVICTNKTSLPEVGGDAAMYFDGYDEKDLAEKMYRVLIDEKLQQKMIKKGFEQSKKFSWNKTTKEILQIYQNL